MTRRKRPELEGQEPGRPGAMRLAVLLLLAIATFVTFAGVLRNDWLLFDDPHYVLDNPHVNRGWTLEGMRWFLTHAHAANWHPLTSWSHMLDVQLFGLGPVGHHAMSLVLHVLNAVMAVVVLRRLTGAWWRSVLVGALFALHPLRVESVAWVAERKDVLSGLFFWLTLESYRRWAERPSAGRYSVVMIALALGLMAKPMLVTLPFVLVLLDVWPLGRLPGVLRPAGASPVRAPARSIRGLMVEKWPLLALAAGSAVVTFFVQRNAGAVASTVLLPLSRRLPNALLSWWRYVGKAVWPSDLAVFYPYPLHMNVAAAVLAGVGLVAVTAAVVRLARARPYLLVGWLWFAGMLVPVIGLVQVGAQASADRYTYLPVIGLTIALVWWLGDVVTSRPAFAAPLAVASIAALVALSIATVRQVGTWKNTYTLFTHALAVTRDNPTSESCLGYALFRAGQPAQAIPHFEKALLLSPTFPGTRNWLGSSLGALGRYREGEAEFREELRQRETAEVHSNLGLILERQGHVEEAMPEFAAALRLDPDHVPALVRVGAILAAKGRTVEAEGYLERAVGLNPADSETRRMLAATLVQEDRVEDAIHQYEAILRASPDDLDALNNVAWIRATHRDAAHRNGVEAVRLAERARDHSPEPVAVLYSTLAASYAEAGRYADAVAAGERAVDLARRANSSSEAERYAQQLALYRAGRPFHFAP